MGLSIMMLSLLAVDGVFALSFSQKMSVAYMEKFLVDYKKGAQCERAILSSLKFPMYIPSMILVYFLLYPRTDI